VAAGAVVALAGVLMATGTDMVPYAGGGTWQSLVLAVMEAGVVVGLSVWLLDVFRRRYDHQGPLARGLSRAAYGAFLVHQLVLVGFVLATRSVAWPPELEFLMASHPGGRRVLRRGRGARPHPRRVAHRVTAAPGGVT
jgi:hypothetical protein